MKIQILSIGKRPPAWLEAGCLEYQKRLPSSFTLEMRDLSPINQGTKLSVEERCSLEGRKILAHLPDSAYCIALDRLGMAISTEKMSQNLAQWQLEQPLVTFLIGGADGLSRPCLKRAQQTWSLSALTFPHRVAKLILVEQIYRSWCILQSHPYHR